MIGLPAPSPFDPGLLRRGRDLRAGGVEPARGRWHHVRHGYWLPEVLWRQLTPEQQHAALVHATAAALGREGPVFALTSAAAIWGLPRIEPWPDMVRVLVPSEQRGRASALVRPHVGREGSGVENSGVRVTTVARTVVDLARTGSLASALAAADHALRLGLCTRGELLEEAEGVPPRVRGRRRARLAVELADGASMSPGESLSRAQMYLLNLPRPRLQEEVHDDGGLIGVCDFGWDGVVGEFDGRVKYRAGTESVDVVEDVVWREKTREDRLRRRRRLARWTWDIAMDPRRLGRRLAEVGIRPTPVNTWIDLAARSAG